MDQSQIEISVRENGPILISGAQVVLKDSAGKAYDLAGKTGIALCRCGASTNKPFCDGSHRGAGFVSRCVSA